MPSSKTATKASFAWLSADDFRVYERARIDLTMSDYNLFRWVIFFLHGYLPQAHTP